MKIGCSSILEWSAREAHNLATRCSTTLSSNVKLPHEIIFMDKFGHVVLGYPRQRHPRAPPSGLRTWKTLEPLAWHWGHWSGRLVSRERLVWRSSQEWRGGLEPMELNRPGGDPGANGWFIWSTAIQMPPRRGVICRSLT